MKGKVKFFNSTKGFGFIVGDDGQEVFVHQSGLGEGVVLRDNDSVEYDVEQGDRGPKAVNVKKVDESQQTEDNSEEESQETQETEDNSE